MPTRAHPQGRLVTQKGRLLHGTTASAQGGTFAHEVAEGHLRHAPAACGSGYKFHQLQQRPHLVTLAPASTLQILVCACSHLNQLSCASAAAGGQVIAV